MAEGEKRAAPQAGAGLVGEQGPVVAVSSGLILVLAISAIDKLTGYDLPLSMLHLIPVAIATWAAGRGWGFALAALAVLIWIGMFRNAHHFQGSGLFFIEGAVIFAALAVFAALLGRLRDALADAEQRFTAALEELDEAIYVADPARREVLYGNRRFHYTFGGRPYDSLDQIFDGRPEVPDGRSGRRYRVRQKEIRWTDGRKALLRVLGEI